MPEGILNNKTHCTTSAVPAGEEHYLKNRSFINCSTDVLVFNELQTAHLAHINSQNIKAYIKLKIKASQLKLKKQ